MQSPVLSSPSTLEAQEIDDRFTGLLLGGGGALRFSASILARRSFSFSSFAFDAILALWSSLKLLIH